jgi:hypothetical protein
VLKTQDKMSWNHRILVTEHEYIGQMTKYFQIHEVYYDNEGKPNGYTANAIDVGGEDVESIEWTLNKMKEALTKPKLWGDNKFPKEYKE